MSSSFPRARFADIIDNAEAIDGYLRGIDRAAFARDRMRKDAVERCLERISEAARRIGPLAADLFPDVDWSAVRGFGNIARHEYERVSADVIWRIATLELPPVADAARRALSLLPDDPS
jgi:uncharacterized protein with HEPN domain